MYSDGAEGPQRPDEDGEQQQETVQRFRNNDLPLAKLWSYYYGIGGEIDEMSMDAYLHEALDIPPAQASLIATAMTELTEGDP